MTRLLICDPLSENPTIVCIFIKLLITSLLSRGKTNGLSKFQPYLMNSCGVIAIDSMKCNKINLYSGYMGKKLQALILSIITHKGNKLWRWDVPYCLHHELGYSARVLSALFNCYTQVTSRIY